MYYCSNHLVYIQQHSASLTPTSTDTQLFMLTAYFFEMNAFVNFCMVVYYCTYVCVADATNVVRKRRKYLHGGACATRDSTPQRNLLNLNKKRHGASGAVGGCLVQCRGCAWTVTVSSESPDHVLVSDFIRVQDLYRRLQFGRVMSQVSAAT